MKNLLDLTGKLTIVIGGSRGLGSGMTTGLLNAGASYAIIPISCMLIIAVYILPTGR